MRGTAFAGGLVDLVIQAGGDHIRYDGLDFTASNRARQQARALLDAIDNANEIVDHMGYEIIRIVEITPQSEGYAPYIETREAAVADSAAFAPTPVFGGSDSVYAAVTIVYELRKLPVDPE